MQDFDHAVRATRGAREYQEDTAALWQADGDPAPAGHAVNGGNGKATPLLVAVLADGMGGHAGGALASRIVCEKFLSGFTSHEGSSSDRLVDALNTANAAVADQVSENPMLSGMGSTLVGAAFGDSGVEWVSVGDSPLLLWRRGEIALLNEDHSLAPELDRMAAAGRITVDEARRDPRRHMLRSAVTGEELDLVDISRRPLALEPGDYVILASDGVQTLDVTEIERVVTAYANDGAAAVASALVRAVEALRDPHQDNTTIVAVRAKPSESA